MTHEDFKKILLTRMYAFLKPLGFRKRGCNFVAQRNDVQLFIQLQSSTRTTHDTLVVTVNLGIASILLAKKQGFRTSPSILDSHWRERIGHFTSESQDKWWIIRNEVEAVAAGDEITMLLQTSSIPMMNSISSTRRLRELWETGQSPGLTDFQRSNYLTLLAE